MAEQKVIKLLYSGKYEVRSELEITTTRQEVLTRESKCNRIIYDLIMFCSALVIAAPFLYMFFGHHGDLNTGWFTAITLTLICVIGGIFVLVFTMVPRFENHNYTFQNTTTKQISRYYMNVMGYRREGTLFTKKFEKSFTFGLTHKWYGRLLTESTVKEIEKKIHEFELTVNETKLRDQVHEELIARIKDKPQPTPSVPSDDRFANIDFNDK